MSTPIAVLGAGSWGTALAVLLAGNGHPTLLWARDTAQVAAMARERCNRRYLPEVVFPDALEPVTDSQAAMARAEDILLVPPARGFRALLSELAPHIRPRQRLAWATKGLEPASGMLLHEVAAEVLGARVPVAVVSGPTFAREVAVGLPAAVTVAASTPALATHFAARLHGPSFRAYTSDDMVGVEVGGAVKNVLAIAAGIADGLGFGANTRAALVTRGLAEMMRLGVALGGKRDTFMGLAGLGDLVLTCTDDQSRNRRLGLALARGESVEQACASLQQVVEGVDAAPVVARQAQRLGVEMPIVEQVCRVLTSACPPREAVNALLAREPKAERE